MSRLSSAAERFRPRLEIARRKLEGSSLRWYPYGTLSNVDRIETLLASDEEPILGSARTKGVLDLGCGDGDLSFLFESMGCKVTAIDNPATNHNGMRAVRALKAELESSIEVFEMDIDSQFSLPARNYGLSIFLGTLYHLKNPFYVMETLARCSDYCIMSTRVARRLPDGNRLPDKKAIAYLLDTYELNDDQTNYWIFSEAALRRLLKRTGWECLRSFTVGDRRRSDPVSMDHDERAFCLLKGHFGLTHLRLLSGWNQAEPAGWRWTGREFAIGFRDDRARHYARMVMRVYVPPELISRLGPLTLSARVDGRELKPEVFNRSGHAIFERSLGTKPGVGPASAIHFSLDKSFVPGGTDGRELGIVVGSIEFD